MMFSVSGRFEQQQVRNLRFASLKDAVNYCLMGGEGTELTVYGNDAPALIVRSRTPFHVVTPVTGIRRVR